MFTINRPCEDKLTGTLDYIFYILQCKHMLIFAIGRPQYMVCICLISMLGL